MHVGVDTSTRSICLGCLGKTERDWEWDWIGLDGTLFDKIVQAYQIIYDWVLKNQAQDFIVGVEEPVYVNNGKTHLALCCIYSAVIKAFLDWGITPESVNISTWKKYVVGKGNSKKDIVRAYMVDRLELPEDLDQDVYDALAIGLFVKGRGFC